MALDTVREIPGLGNLVNRLSPKFEPTEEEKEFLDEYSKVLSYLLQDWEGKCPEEHLKENYFVMPFFNPEDFGEFIQLAKDLGLIGYSNGCVSLTERGRYFAKHY